MAEATVQISLRGDTAANWQARNPVLAKNEPGIVEGTPLRKTGDGVTAWNSLPYDFEPLLASEIAPEHVAAAGLALRPLLIYILNHLGTGGADPGTTPGTGIKPPPPTNPAVDDVANTFTYYPGGADPSIDPGTGTKPVAPTNPDVDDVANTFTYYPSGATAPITPAVAPAAPTDSQVDDVANTFTYYPSGRDQATATPTAPTNSQIDDAANTFTYTPSS